jgi:uncharacterized protein
MLFKVAGTNVLICGSIHMLPPGMKAPAAMLDAILTAEDLFFESDLDAMREPEFGQYAKPDRLENHIPKALFVAAEALSDAIGIHGLSCLKPWWAALRIGVTLIIRSGNDIRTGVDRQLWDAMKAMGRNPTTLDAKDVLRIFDDAPMSEQIARLEYIVFRPEIASEVFRRLLDGWFKGDSVALERELQTMFDLFPVSSRSLIYDRNRQWLPVIVKAIESGRRSVFVVGVLHLVGNYSLQRFLKDHGFDVVLVSTAEDETQGSR